MSSPHNNINAGDKGSRSCGGDNDDHNSIELSSHSSKDEEKMTNNTKSWWTWTTEPSDGGSITESGAVVKQLTEEREDQEKMDARDLLSVSPLPLICPLSPAPRIELPLEEPFLPAPTRRSKSEVIKETLRLLGPGWLVAMAYIDPGNLEGDLSAGALRSSTDPLVGYRLLWVLLWATMIGFGLQRLAIKLGTATGNDLATVCRKEFPSWMAAVIWVFTEVCLVGADIQAVIGSAIGLKLILGIPISLGIVVTLLDTFIVLLIDTCGTRKLEACFASLVSLMAFCFFANMVTSKPDVAAVFEGLTEISIPEGSLPFTVALIGSVIMPHNFFLQSAVVQSRAIDRSNERQIKRVARIYIIEIFCLLCVSLLINIAVVVAFANPKISSPDGSPLDLYNAHTALESAIGTNSRWIWGLGLLAAGQCSTMACTYAGQFVMEGLLGLRIKKLWLRVVVTRLTSIIPLLTMIYWQKGTVELIANWVNILQAFNLPFTLTLLLKFTSSAQVMGSFTLSPISKYIAFFSGCFLVTANVNLVISQLGSSYIVVLVLLIYFSMLGYLWTLPIKNHYPHQLLSSRQLPTHVL